MMKNTAHRVALVGYGLAGSVFHAPLIGCTAGLELKAIVTSNPERAGKAKRDVPDAQILNSADEIFAHASGYDLVVIAAPNKYHAPLARASLEAGLATVVDKPIAAASSDVRQLIHLSKKNQTLLSVYHNRRWDNDFLTIRKILDEDLLGTISRFESRTERFRPEPKAGAWRESAERDDAGGLLFDLGSHLIDQACVLFGRPRSVYAEVATRRPAAMVDDDVFVALQFENNVCAHMWTSSVTRINGARFRLSGLRGSYEKYGVDPQEDALRAGKLPTDAAWGKEDASKWGRLCTTIGGTAGGGLPVDRTLETEKGSWEAYYANIRDVLEGTASVAVKPEEALLTTLVIEAAFKSAADKQVVSLNTLLF